MQIKNPSNKAIENVKIFGISYSIEAEGTLDNVPEAHARYWQELHKFLILRKDKLEEVKKEEVVEIPAPAVAEVITPSEEKAEVVEEVLETPAETTVAEEVIEVAPPVKEKKAKKVK